MRVFLGFARKVVGAGHYTRACNLYDYEAHRRICARVADLEQSGRRVLYGTMNLAYCTNIIVGLPNRFRFWNMQVNLLQHIQDHEDYPVNQPRPSSDNDDNSRNQEFSLGSYSADSD